MTWSSFEGPQAAVHRAEELLAPAQQRDLSVVVEPSVPLAPTEALQDTSTNSGWGERFFEVASAFDGGIGELTS